MTEKYGKLYNEWEKLVDNAIVNNNLDEWRNIRCFYEHFRTRFMEGIQQIREFKRRKLNNDVNGS